MPADIREVRLIYGTTFNTTHIAANNALWATGTAHKLPVAAVDLSKLVHVGIPSKVRRQRIYGAAAPIPGLAKSELSLSMYLGGGTGLSVITPTLQATLAGHVLGGIANPPATKTLACENSCTTTNIKCTGHGLAAGQAVLINNEPRRIASINTNDFTLDMALSGAPSLGATIVIASTAYLNDTGTIYYWDLLALGLHAEDQIQTLGCMGGMKISGLKPGEAPELGFDLIVPGWQEVPVAERASLTPTTAPEGDTGSTASQSLGAFWIQDNGTTTRATMKCADWEIDPGVTFIPKEDRSGLNGIGGFARGMGVPRAKCRVYIDEDYGLNADFTAKTAKQIAFQLGNSAGACVLVTMPKCYLAHKPVRSDIGDMAAYQLEFIGEAPGSVLNHAFAVHWF